MERSAKYVVQGAALVTLLLGTQSSTARPVLCHELSFDEHGRIVGPLAVLAHGPSLEPDPGTFPNNKC